MTPLVTYNASAKLLTYRKMKSLNQYLPALVELLNDGEFHDATTIRRRLDLSSAAVAKLIKLLDDNGVSLIFIEGKGYQLQNPLILLDIQQLYKHLQHNSIQLQVLDTVASTNDHLKSLSKNNQKIIACFAEEQTAGKGRLQRQWHSPFAENIYLSVLCPFANNMSELSGLSLVAALAICHAIESALKLEDNTLALKWPNDILIAGRKLAGMLLEIEAESKTCCQVIIGVGINVNMSQALQTDITQPWISLYHLTQRYIDRNVLGAKLIDTMIDYFERFSVNGLAGFVQEWQQRDCLKGAMISATYNHQTVSGRCLGINHQGHLQLQAENGDTLILASAATTLLKS